jgi:succinate dehydrogenase / fumarate reductase cytochrome b subunit
MLSMMMSIVHRITGAALYSGSLILAWWLLAAASGPEAYATFSAVAGSWIGMPVLFGYTWALVHHLLGGLKHLWWDTGRGFEKAEIEFLARGSLGLSVALTLLLWIVGLSL